MTECGYHLNADGTIALEERYDEPKSLENRQLNRNDGWDEVSLGRLTLDDMN